MVHLPFFRAFAFLYFLVLIAVAACSDAGERNVRTSGGPDQSALEDFDPGPIVTAAHPLAVEAGANILRAGGSAVDAAVAVQAVLGLVEPQSSGLGGGAFMLFYDAETSAITAYDGREHAPASVTPDAFLKDDGTPMGFFEAVLSGKAVGVPGAVAMLGLAHEEHGTLPWADLFDDAVDLAENGFPMPDRFHQTLRRLSSFREDPATAIFFDEDGAPLAVGEKVTNAEYASTLRQLASDGPALFYSGAIADAIIARVNSKTGEETMRKSDFLAYEPMKRKPLCKEFEGSTVCSMPPPSSGGVTLLQIMTMFKERAGGRVPADAVLAYLEATRLAYADRGRFLGDPEAMGTEVFSSDALTKALISQPYLQGRAMLIGKAPASTVEPGNPSGSYMIREGRTDGDAYEVPSTSHFSIRDGAGNVVSMTTTVEMPFGSQMMVAGMVLNNQLTDFSRVPGDGDKPAANAPGPGKRPMSSMTPVIVLDTEGVPSVVMGSPGGPAIIGYVAKPLLTHFLSDTTLADAIKEHHFVVPRGSIIVEKGGDDLKAKAEALGYDVKEQRLTSGIYGFSLRSGALDLAIDPRREGTALAGDEITTATAVAQP